LLPIEPPCDDADGAAEPQAKFLDLMTGLDVGELVSTYGSSFDEALDETVDVLREYAVEWQDHLLGSVNHRNNWGLGQLISLGDDDRLEAWLAGTDR
jgi:hypothetical protein